MNLLSLITFLLITFSIALLIVLYKELINWNIQFDKTLKEYNHDTNSNNKHPMEGEKAFNFTAISMNSNKKITLEKILDKNLILIFINSECIYCDNNIEIFLSEAEKHPTFKYVIVMSNLEKRQAESILNLYEGKIEILITDQQTLLDFKIEYWPSFFHIDSDYRVQNVTPIPILVFNNMHTALN